MEKDNVNILNLNLDQYIKQIEKLRIQLSRLNKDSAEYAQVEQEIKETQRDLTQVLLDNADAFEGLNEAAELNKVLMASARIEAGEYDKTVDGLKQHIKDLELISRKIDYSSDEYKKVTAEANRLKSVLKDLKGDTAEARLEADEYANSLNGMRQKLSDMKAVLGNLDMGSETFKSLAKEANKLNDEIKEAEESYGVFSRNVGNYANSFKEAFSDMGFSLDNIMDKSQKLDGFLTRFRKNFSTAFEKATKDGKTLGTTIKGITSGLIEGAKGATGLSKALAPLAGSLGIIAVVVGTILAAFNAMKMSIQNDEETSDKWNESLSELRATVQVIKNLFQDWGKSMVDVTTPVIKNITSSINGFINGTIKGLGEIYELLDGTLYKFKEIRNYFGDYFVDLAKWVGGFTPIATFFGTLGKILKADGDKLIEQAEEYEAIRQRQILIDKAEVDFTKLKRANLVELAKLEVELYKVKEKAADKDNYSAEKRLEFLNEAKEIELQMLSIKETEAKIEWDILKLKAEQGTNSSEDNDKLAEAEANYIKARAEVAKKEAEYTKQAQAIIQDRKAQLNQELQAQIRYWQTVQKNNKQTSEEFKKAKIEELKLSHRLQVQEINDMKISADTKKKLLKEIKEQYENEAIKFNIDFDLDVLDEKYKELVDKINELPYQTKDAFETLEESIKAYKQEYINTIKEISRELPDLKIDDSFYKDMENAMKDMSQNFIPVTVDNLKKYMSAMGKTITSEQEELFNRVEKRYGKSFTSIMSTIQGFNEELERVGNNKKLLVLDEQVIKLEQSVRILDSTYRQFMKSFETDDFTADVTAYFKNGEMSLRGYLTELAKYTNITMAQVDSLKNEKQRLEGISKVQEERINKNNDLINTLQKEAEANENNLKIQIKLNKALEERDNLNTDYSKTISQINDLTEAITKLDNIKIDFSFIDNNTIANQLKELFNIDSNEFDSVVSKASEDIKRLFVKILNNELSTDDIDKAIADVREYVIKGITEITGENIDTDKANSILNLIVPDTTQFKQKADKAFSEVEDITKKQLQKTMQWYDEGNKKIIDSYGEVLLAQKKLEREHAKIDRDESPEERQRRIYEATVEYEQKILDWERTFFDERRKQYDEESKSDYLSPEHVEKAFNEQREALKQVYDEQMEMLKTQLENELVTEEEYEQKKLEIKQKYNDAKKSLDADEVSEMSKVNNENDPLKANEIDAEERRIEQEKQILEEWYAQKLAMYAGNEEMLLEIQKEYAQRSMELTNRVAQNEEAKLKRRMTITQQWANATGKLFSQVAQYMEQDIEDKKKKGEATEEEMHKEFELMKAFQISAAIIDTLSGALGIYMSYLSAPGLPWVNQALGWTSMGLALTSGFLQVQQIEATRFGDSNTSAGGGMSQIAATPVSYSNVNVNPLLDQNADMGSYSNLSVNATDNEENELRVTILESDIQESNARVATRQAKTHF